MEAAHGLTEARLGAAALMTRADSIAFAPNPGPQELLLNCALTVQDVFYGGRRGGGKTYGLLGDWIAHQTIWGSQATGVLFRKSYPEIEEVERLAGLIYPGLRAQWKASDRKWIFPGGAVLKLRYLERDSDADAYQGHSYTWMGFDELGNWASFDGIDKLWACLRSADGVFCVRRCTGNPGGPGHNLCKARYVDPAPPLTPFAGEDGITRVYIPSGMSDNPKLMEADPTYPDRIKAATAGNEALYRAWMHGDWDIVAGGMFDDLWHKNKDRIVLEPFEVPKSWKVYRAFDWGSSAPFSVGWWAVSDGTEAPNGRHYPRGSLFRIAEWYGSTGKPNEGLKMLASEIGAGIKLREDQMGFNGDVRPGPADSAIYARENGMCIADDLHSAGVDFIPADKRPGTRKIRWQKMREMLAAHGPNMERPVLCVFDRCRDFIRTVPVLPRDKKDPDDIATDAEDHAADEAAYMVLSAGGATTARMAGH